MTPVDALGPPAAAAQRLQDAASALTPAQREDLAPMHGPGGFWRRAQRRAGLRPRSPYGFTANATRCVRGTPGPYDADVFATTVRRLPHSLAEALHDELTAAAARSHAGGEAAIGNVLDALADFIKASHFAAVDAGQ